MYLTHYASSIDITLCTPLNRRDISLPSLLVYPLNGLPRGFQGPHPGVHLEHAHHQALREAADPDYLLVPQVRRRRILRLTRVLQHHEEFVRLQVVTLEVVRVQGRREGGVQEGHQFRLLHEGVQIRLEVVLQTLIFEVLEQVDEGATLDVPLVDVSHYL